MQESFPGGSNGKGSARNVGDLSSIAGSGRSSGKGNGNPFQYSSLENSMNRGAWWAIQSMGQQRVRHNFHFTLHVGKWDGSLGTLSPLSQTGASPIWEAPTLKSSIFFSGMPFVPQTVIIVLKLGINPTPSQIQGFLGGADGKGFGCNKETWVRSLGQEDPMEEEMAAHSSILAWRIPWTEKPGGLWSMGSQNVRHD